MCTRQSAICILLAVGAAVPQLSLAASGQAPKPAATAPAARAATTAAPAVPVAPPSGYVIGPDDVLSIVFWREKDMSLDVAVRPDGRISLPLLNDVQAAGLTPPELRERLMEESKRFIEDPNVTVIIRQINSRKVYVTGEVGRPGPYPLGGPTTVLQMIATAGGLHEYADDKNIIVMRNENGRMVAYPFNYRDVTKRRNLKQNLELKPGDTIVVP
jgi:polysaccharide export outer membrane protein